ncbi:hypothetical protein BVRB_4g083470 [Beta vulgaris subsp. vulgaris]|nr:hypothetical protein BVRB_4g083470 [Beta vulgaris subsp. vulgaris]
MVSMLKINFKFNETQASKKVENILIMGHSRCVGIRALMGMQDEEEDSRFKEPH